MRRGRGDEPLPLFVLTGLVVLSRLVLSCPVLSYNRLHPVGCSWLQDIGSPWSRPVPSSTSGFRAIWNDWGGTGPVPCPVSCTLPRDQHWFSHDYSVTSCLVSKRAGRWWGVAWCELVGQGYCLLLVVRA